MNFLLHEIETELEMMVSKHSLRLCRICHSLHVSPLYPILQSHLQFIPPGFIHSSMSLITHACFLTLPDPSISYLVNSPWLHPLLYVTHYTCFSTLPDPSISYLVNSPWLHPLPYVTHYTCFSTQPDPSISYLVNSPWLHPLLYVTHYTFLHSTRSFNLIYSSFPRLHPLFCVTHYTCFSTLPDPSISYLVNSPWLHPFLYVTHYTFLHSTRSFNLISSSFPRTSSTPLCHSLHMFLHSTQFFNLIFCSFPGFIHSSMSSLNLLCSLPLLLLLSITPLYMALNGRLLLLSITPSQMALNGRLLLFMCPNHFSLQTPSINGVRLVIRYTSFIT